MLSWETIWPCIERERNSKQNGILEGIVVVVVLLVIMVLPVSVKI